MKARWIPIFLALVSAAVPVQGHVFTRPAFVAPDGQKRVGPYIWVWHSAKVPPSGNQEINADCPLNYVALGGGYAVKGGFILFDNKPNAAFDGWVITGIGGYNQGATVTAYASCAPAQ
jgi:hypothetical protein